MARSREQVPVPRAEAVTRGLLLTAASGKNDSGIAYPAYNRELFHSGFCPTRPIKFSQRNTIVLSGTG